MKSLVILGAGSGGTMLANRMHKRLPADLDPHDNHRPHG